MPEQNIATRLVVPTARPADIVIPQQDAPSDRANINILLVLWRRRWIILICVLAALISSAVYLVNAVRIYGSNSVIYVQASIPKIIGDEVTNAENSAGYLYTQCQLIQSTTILGAALQIPGVAEARCLRDFDNPVDYLKSAVSAVPGKQGDLITVSMESTNAQDAALIVNAVVESYIEYQSKQHQSTAAEVLRILQGEGRRRETELIQAEKAMLNFKKDNPEVSLQTDKGNLQLTHLSELSEALNQAQLKALDLSTDVAVANAAENDPTELRLLMQRNGASLNSASGADPQLLAEYRDQSERLADLQDDLGPDHPLVGKAQVQLGRIAAEIDQATQNAAKSYLALLRQTLDESNLRIRKLQDAVAEERKAAIDVSVKQAEYDQLTQDGDRAQRALDLLDSRMKDINVSEDVGSLTVSVLEAAKPNGRPIRPQATQTLGMGLIAGLMTGLGGALLRDMMDQRLRSAEEISLLLDLPILGAVPHMDQKLPAMEKGQEIQRHPRSDVAEAYRTVRTAIYFGMAQASNAKTILVTSPAPGDGKTTLISNLAIAIAQSGRRVLLIDADCRRPMQHKIFKLGDGPGLSSVIAGQTTLKQAVRKMNNKMLEILPCGPLPPNPAELLNSQAFLDLLADVSKEYDQIVIDSPPVMPVTDARILAASCDVTVLVLRAEKSTRRLAEHARNALASVGGIVLGVVVNDVPRGQNGYGYYYYGYRRYGYTYGGPNGKRNGNGNGNGGHSADLATVPLTQAALEDQPLPA